jgi:hypothetical protein
MVQILPTANSEYHQRQLVDGSDPTYDNELNKNLRAANEVVQHHLTLFAARYAFEFPQV